MMKVPAQMVAQRRLNTVKRYLIKAKGILLSLKAINRAGLYISLSTLDKLCSLSEDLQEEELYY